MTTRGRRSGEDRITPIILPSIDGSMFNLSTMQGRPYMLSFLRFASCPFCNMRIHELVARFDELGGDFGIVAIFDSPLENLQKNAQGHRAPFPILADEMNDYYRAYGIERSLSGMVKGMFMRMPTLIRGMSKGYVPTDIQGSTATMPADFLVDEEGIIRIAHYGRDAGDHLPFSQVKAFAQNRGKSLFERSVAG